jgi:hypothetical protein
MTKTEREKELRAMVKRAAKYKRKWWVMLFTKANPEGVIGNVWPHYLTRKSEDGRIEQWHPYLADPNKTAIYDTDDASITQRVQEAEREIAEKLAEGWQWLKTADGRRDEEPWH